MDQEKVDSPSIPSLSIPTGAGLDDDTGGTHGLSGEPGSASTLGRHGRSRSISSGRGKKRVCKRCMRDFLAIGNQQFCKLTDCVAPSMLSQNPPTERESRKRFATSPPAGPTGDARKDKKKKTASSGSSVAPLSSGMTVQPPDLRQLEENFDSLSEQDLRQRAKAVLDAARYYELELIATRAKFDEYRIRFADKIFESLPSLVAASTAALTLSLSGQPSSRPCKMTSWESR